MSSDESPTVLFVSTGPSIANPASGEGTRLKHLSRGLANRGCDVLALVPEEIGDDPDWIRQTYTYQQWSFPFLLDVNRSYLSSLATVLRGEDIDVIHTSNGACSAAVLTWLLSPDTTVTYAAQNVEAAHARDFVDPELHLYKRLLGPRLIPWIERATVACADLITTVSEKDRDEFQERYVVDSSRVEAIPTGTQSVSQERLRPRDEVRRELGLDGDRPVDVFHGSYAHPPNEEAIDLIVDEIAPALESRDLDMQFLHAGKGIIEVDNDDIVVAGFVEDLFSVLNVADLAIVPIRHGGGTKTKMYDYITLALPIVTTQKGVEGIDLHDGTHAVITDEVDASIIEGIADVVRDSEYRDRLRTHLEKLSQSFSWDRSVEKLDRFYRQ